MNRENLTLFLCCLAQSSQWFIRTSFSLLLPIMKADLNLTYSMAGLILSSFFIGYTIMQIPSGLISDKYGSKKLITLSLIGIGVSVILVGLAPNYFSMIVFIIIMGFLGGNIYVPATRTIAGLFSSKRGQAMGTLTVSSVIGIIVATALVPVLGNFFGWRNTLLLLGSLPLISSVFIKFLFEDPKLNAPIIPTVSSFKSIFGLRDIWFFGIASGILHISSGILNWLPTFLVEHHGIQYVLMGFILAGIRILASPIPFISGWLSDKFNRKKVILFSLIARLPFLILLTRLPLYPSLIVLSANSIAGGFAFPVINTSVQDIVKREKAGTAVGLVNTLAQIGSLLGPFLASLILEFTGSYTRTFDVGALLVFLSIIFIYITK